MEGSLFFLTRNFQIIQNFTILTLVFTLPLRISLKPWTLSFKNKHNHSENCITVKVSRRTQKVEICLANEGSALLTTDLAHIFWSNVCNEFGVMLRWKGPHKLKFAYDLVRIHPLMIYTELVMYNIVGDTKAPLLRCFLFVSKLKAGDIITAGQYMNYQTFSNLHFRPLLKIFFIVFILTRETLAVKK